MGKNRVVFIRHSERLDKREEYNVEDWPDRDRYPWDTPICNSELPRLVGQKLRTYLETETDSTSTSSSTSTSKKGKKIRIKVIVSPFTRCIQTASHICSEMGIPTFSVDKSFGEQMLAIWHTTRRDYFNDVKYIQSNGSVVTTTPPPLPDVLEKDPNGKFRFDSDYLSQNLYRSYEYMIEVKNKINQEIQIAPSWILGSDVPPHETTQNTFSRYTESAINIFSKVRNKEISDWSILTINKEETDITAGEEEDDENEEIGDDVDTMTVVVSHGDCVASIGYMCGLQLYEVQVCGFLILEIGEREGEYPVVHKDRVSTIEDHPEDTSGGSPFSVNLGNR